MMKWAASCTVSGGAIYNHLCRKYLGHKFRHYDLVISFQESILGK